MSSVHPTTIVPEKQQIQCLHDVNEKKYMPVDDMATQTLTSNNMNSYVTSSNSAKSYYVQQTVQLRFLNPHDLPEIKKLCSEWFPIDYPDTWYEEITSNPRFYSLAATFEHRIIGMIISEIKTKARCNREDQDILAKYFPPSTQMAYILSLGVVGDFRRNGIASLLLDSLLSYLTSGDSFACKAVYLHVLSSNTAAIQFYEHRKFHVHCFLPYYYSIKGSPRDGYSYVLYINGGQAPWTFMDYVNNSCHAIMSFHPCSIPQRILKAVIGVWNNFMFSSSSSSYAPRL